MIEQILTTTRVISSEGLSAQDLERLIFYYGGPGAGAAVIEDNRPFPLRDGLLSGLEKLVPLRRLNKVFPDPKVADIMDMAGELKDAGAGIIIGIGGGSTMDSAKGVAAVLSNGGDLDDYLGPQATRRIEKKEVKLILIPTTAGTGAEVTKFGVYTARSGRKYTLNNPLLQADAALLVNEFTYGMPPALMAATGFDALSHAMETLWNRNATPVSDRIATRSAVHILRWIRTAYENEKEGHAEMLRSACMAGIAFNMTGTAAVHALSFILSEEWHVPHGTACAFTLEDVMRINMRDPATCAKLARLSAALSGHGGSYMQLAEELLGRIVELKRALSLPSAFADIGVDKGAEELLPLFEKSLDDPKMKNNIVPFDLKTIGEIIASKCRC
jgi:alcohol dehydrogenase class IV